MEEHYRTMIKPHGKNPFHGLAPGPGAILVNGNDYLSLTNDPEIKQAQIRAVRGANGGPQQSAVYIDSPQIESEKRVFEKEFAAFLNFEGCTVCQSGYTANVGLIQSIAGPGVPVYVDFFAHSSLYEGVKSGRASLKPFRHNDMNSLRRVIASNGPGVIAVDSLYSTFGDFAPLVELVEIAEETGCALVVDESHSLGVFGENGRGLVHALQLQDRVDFITASLAKGFVTRAGVVAARSDFLRYFAFASFPAIFSSVVEPWEAIRVRAVLDVIQKSNERRERVRQFSEIVRDGLREKGVNIGPTQSQIIPLIFRSEADTFRVHSQLERAGIFGSLFCRPATPKNKSMVRLSINSGLTMGDIARLMEIVGSLAGRNMARPAAV